MSARMVGLISWSMCAFSLALLLPTLNTIEPGVKAFEHWIENTALAIGFSTVGAVVATRSHPQNPMGWFFCVVGLLFAAVLFLAEYAIYAVPIAMGIAIQKYHLYDIDLLINRTLVYGALTVTLVACYFGAIVLSQRLFVALTGEQSTLAVVASTLVIAALFAPLRQRVQDFVDRPLLPQQIRRSEDPGSLLRPVAR